MGFMGFGLLGLWMGFFIPLPASPYSPLRRGRVVSFFNGCGCLSSVISFFWGFELSVNNGLFLLCLFESFLLKEIFYVFLNNEMHSRLNGVVKLRWGEVAVHIFVKGFNDVF